MMWSGSSGSTVTVISLSGPKSCPSLGVLQLMSTAAAGSPDDVQRNFRIFRLLSLPLVWPAAATSSSDRSGAHFMATRSAVEKGWSRADDGWDRPMVLRSTAARTITVRRMRPLPGGIQDSGTPDAPYPAWSATLPEPGDGRQRPAGRSALLGITAGQMGNEPIIRPTGTWALSLIRHARRRCHVVVVAVWIGSEDGCQRPRPTR